MIDVISTFAEDEIVRVDRDTTTELAGPAFWIQKTLSSLEAKFQLHTPPRPARVRIVVSKNGENGSIISQPKIEVAKIPKTSNIFLISTVGNQFDLENIIEFNGVIAIDLQGYLRQKVAIVFSKAVQKKVSILKVNEFEAKKMPNDFFENQKQRVLIVTKGRGGCDLYDRGNHFTYKSNHLLNLPDTIGAGDTFFSSFCFYYQTKRNADVAIKEALIHTEKFLKEKMATNI